MTKYVCFIVNKFNCFNFFKTTVCRNNYQKLTLIYYFYKFHFYNTNNSKYAHTCLLPQKVLSFHYGCQVKIMETIIMWPYIRVLDYYSLRCSSALFMGLSIEKNTVSQIIIIILLDHWPIRRTM